VEDTEYQHTYFVLAPGETLLLHTDGATECRDPDGRRLGDEAFEAMVRGAPADCRGAVLVDHLAGLLTAFAGDLVDDIALLAISAHG
jgi:phosphoserine phosphatase RsbU/P